MITPLDRSSSGRPSIARSSSSAGSSRGTASTSPPLVERRGPDRDAGARLELASACRARRRRRSRRAPSVPSASWTPSSSRLGRLRGVRRWRTRPRDRRRRPSSGAAASAAASVPRPQRVGQRSRCPRRPSRTLDLAADHRSTILRAHAARRRDRPVRADRRRQDRRSRSRSPRGCASSGERPVAVSADALQVYAGLEILTGAARPRERAQLEHRLISFLPVDASFSAGQYAELAHAEIDALLARRRPADRGRRHRALPARGADRAEPAPGAARRRARALDGRARAPRPGGAARGARASARRGRPRRSSRPIASGSCGRWSCSTPASSSRRRASPSCGPTRSAARRCWSAS